MTSHAGLAADQPATWIGAATRRPPDGSAVLSDRLGAFRVAVLVAVGAADLQPPAPAQTTFPGPGSAEQQLRVARPDAGHDDLPRGWGAPAHRCAVVASLLRQR